MKIYEKYSVKQLNTFKIGGTVAFFIEIENIDELGKAFDFAKEKNKKIVLIGNGSDILFDDGFLDFVLIRLNNDYIQKLDEGKYKVSASYSLSKFILFVLNDLYEGPEKLLGIPGTVGGAIWANAGAYGVEIKDFLKEVRVIFLDDPEKKIQTLSNADCSFTYRNSLFKQRPSIILEAIFEFHNKVENYEILKTRYEEILQSRHQKHPLNYPNAGSIFKNVIVNDEIQKKLGTNFPYNKIPAAWLIEQVGLKSYQIGGAQFSSKHANFIINLGDAKAEDVLSLIDKAKKEVKNRFGLDLEEELVYIK